MRSAARVLTLVGTAGAVGIAAHTAVNLRRLRRPRPAVSAGRAASSATVAVLVPARNEADHIERMVTSALAQEGVAGLRVVVLDDGSSDGTGDLVRTVAASDDRLDLITGPDDPPPPGWLGKPWACARLAESPEAKAADVLCFVDADVVLEPDAVQACVDLLAETDLQMVAPYPRQLAGSWLERLVQPLVTWSWVATMPLGWAERSLRPSLSAANGQLIVVRRSAYDRAGGHEAVRGQVLEDIALMRAFKSAGQHTATVDGSHLATCRMYDGPSGVVDGYAKSLWSAFGGPAGSVGVCTLLAVCFVVPAAAAIGSRDRTTRIIGLVGYAAGVGSRAMVARRCGEPVTDTLAQPASIAAFVALNAISWWRHRRRSNAWKGRPVTVDGAS